MTPSFAEVIRSEEQLAKYTAVQHSRHGGYALDFQTEAVGEGDVMVSSCRAHRGGGCDLPRLELQSAAIR